jgi:hypothetical protein
MYLINKKRSDLLSTLLDAYRGLKKHFAGQTLVIDGQPWTAEALMEMIQRHIEGVQAAHLAYEQWLLQTSALQADLRDKLSPALAGLQSYVRLAHGTNSKAYSDHGFAKPKKPYVSAVTKLVASEQARATRKARSTRGKRQRLAIRGAVTPQQIVALFATPSSDGNGE